MTDATIREFLPPPDATPQVVVKHGTKRKKKSVEDKENTEDLKRRARLYCKCPEQWRSISRYAPKRLEEFCQEQEFNRDEKMYNGIYEFAHSMYALAMDKLSLGDGYVEQELKADISLRQCIEIECGQLCKYLTNRYKFLALSTVDVTNGKRRQWFECPAPDPIIEEINGGQDDSSEGGQFDDMVESDPGIGRPDIACADDRPTGEENEEAAI